MLLSALIKPSPISRLISSSRLRSMATIQAKPFRLALVQLGGLGTDKTQNLKIASDKVREAVKVGKADLVVLPVSLAGRGVGTCYYLIS
jgi:hypothetical protein